jgi:ATP/maltotriose-dependent transcriptional regulator MalT
MKQQEEKEINQEVTVHHLPDPVREGLLYLCLLDDPVDLHHLSALVAAPEVVDSLMQLPVTETNLSAISIDQDKKLLLLSGFKWSEKVKAAATLAPFFATKPIRPENLGDLWLLAGQKEKALAAFLAATREYQQQQAHPQGKRTCQKILDLGLLPEEREVEVLQTLLVCYECCGELEEVVQTRHKLLATPLVQTQPEEHASLLRALAIDYAKEGNWGQYKKFRDEAARAFREVGCYGESAEDLMGLASRATDELDLTRGLHFSAEALADAQKSGQMELICKAMAVKAYLTAMDGRYPEGHRLAEEALQLALKNNLLEAAAYVYRKLAGTYEYASDFEQARVVYKEAIQFCETERMEMQTQLCFSCLSWILLRLGEWKKALEMCTGLIKDPAVNNPSKATANCVIAIIKSLRGEIRSAEKHTREGIFLAQKEQFLLMYHLLHLPMAKINELKGNVEGAREWYCKIIEDWDKTQEKHDVLLSLMDAAMFFREQNEQVWLKKSLEIFSFISKETGNTEALGCMAFGLGLDAMLQQKPEAAISHLKEAQKYLEPLHVPYQLLLVEYHLGLSLLLSGTPEKGQQLLAGLLPRANKMGLGPLVSKIHVELANLAQAPQHAPDPDTLTRRQLDVLQLLAAGLSNKEIADRLFLSSRTVDMHVRYIFDKLYCHTRTEAVKIGLERGLVQ